MKIMTGENLESSVMPLKKGLEGNSGMATWESLLLNDPKYLYYPRDVKAKNGNY